MTINSSASRSVPSPREFLDDLFSNGEIGEILGHNGLIEIKHAVDNGVITTNDVRSYVLWLLKDSTIRKETLGALKERYPHEALPKNTPKDVALRVIEKLFLSSIPATKTERVFSLSEAGNTGDDALIRNLGPDEMATIFNTHPVRGKIKPLVDKLLGRTN